MSERHSKHMGSSDHDVQTQGFEVYQQFTGALPDVVTLSSAFWDIARWVSLLSSSHMHHQVASHAYSLHG